MKKYKSAIEIIICDFVWIIISIFSYINLNIHFSPLSTILISTALIILTILVFVADDDILESKNNAEKGDIAANGSETGRKRIVRIFFYIAISLAVSGAFVMIFGRWFE
ncbi:MAG: hypothetical protein J6L77_06375 [Coprococcus sp.]|nr:hypothetical protein [Coprococcus sp.]